MTLRKITGTFTGTIDDAEPTPTPTPTPPPAPSPKELLVDRFDGPDGLITNEWAYWTANDPRAVVSPVWQMTSGSMFRKGGQMWTGVPDGRYVSNDARSESWNHSALFRANTVKSDIKDAQIAFRLTNMGYVSTSPDGVQAWDGIEVWMRYQSQYSLYTASVNRRDNTVNFKKKCIGGPSNSGTYWFSKGAPYTPPLNVPQFVKVTCQNVVSGVHLTLAINDKVVLDAVDDGKTWTTSVAGAVQCAPIIVPGAVGIRADNLQFMLDDFVVTAL